MDWQVDKVIDAKIDEPNEWQVVIYRSSNVVKLQINFSLGSRWFDSDLEQRNYSILFCVFKKIIINQRVSII